MMKTDPFPEGAGRSQWAGGVFLARVSQHQTRVVHPKGLRGDTQRCLPRGGACTCSSPARGFSERLTLICLLCVEYWIRLADVCRVRAFCSVCASPLERGFTCFPHQQVGGCLNPLNLGRPGDLLWPKRCCTSSEPRHQEVLRLLFLLVNPTSLHRREPGLISCRSRTTCLCSPHCPSRPSAPSRAV